jgi:hypothetical protein
MVRFPTGAKRLYLLQSVKTVWGPHPPSYLMCTENISTGLRRPEREVEYSSHSSSCAFMTFTVTTYLFAVHSFLRNSLSSYYGFL